MIEFYRGDTYSFKFQRKRNGEAIESPEENDRIYFTVKNGDYDSALKIFQKSLDNGIVFNDEDSSYHCTINPNDTDGLNYQDYYYDIEVITSSYKRTIASGILRFKKEITLPKDEVI